MCTGTFFRGDQDHDYMVTAAHCTVDGESGWSIKNSAGSADAYVDVADSPVNSDTDVEIAGYGSTERTKDVYPDDIRCATNSINQASFQEGMINIFGIGETSRENVPAGVHSSAAGGDSGGPMLIDRNKKTETIGVVSYGGSNDRDNATGLEPDVFERYVDLTSPRNKEFLSQFGKPKAQNYPYCTNGSDTGSGFGYQPGIGGPNNASCLVPPKGQKPADKQN